MSRSDKHHHNSQEPVVSDLSLMVSDDPWERQSHLSGQGGEDTASSTAGRRKSNVEEVGRLIFF